MEDKAIPQSLLDILACPACDSRPRVELINDGVRCPQCGRIYPMENGIPIMLVGKAVEDGSTQK